MITKKEIKVEAVDTYICNGCGDEYPAELFTGLHEITVEGHYMSNVFADATRYTFSLCEKCLDPIFNKFKHPPTTEDDFLLYP